jgi:hypothetical protein
VNALTTDLLHYEKDSLCSSDILAIQSCLPDRDEIREEMHKNPKLEMR